MAKHNFNFNYNYGQKNDGAYIEITEGCTAYSYLINGIEWAELTYENSEHWTGGTDIINDTFNALVTELETQYNIPAFLISRLYDNFGDDCFDVPCTQDTFIGLVKNNKRTTCENLGHCDECGDTVYKYTLEIKFK